MNTLISYLYRDADNYKFTESVVLKGEISKDDKATIFEKLDNGLYFLPEQVGLNTAFEQIVSHGYRFPTESDHPWHELCSIEKTNQEPTTEVSLDEFIEAFSKITKRSDWDEVTAEEAMPSRVDFGP
ncbi:hypothetical protein Q9L42_020555 (plasmid) [Methylomarinum sp. Ch1-1]|uniref:Integron gene cassette protein n=1 Tax=Methylomarinum roseum TaxID=3067653 RepID=A0AAU7P1D9_9GAMM|nr:hypothetical protein [Methylomarinum sp. Ch1-1]MDP4523311.1 hypothetical protein [Methylomarinum sp. Ch1-1]